jgi:hypothetical protein
MSSPVFSQDNPDITKPTLKGNFIVGGDFDFGYSNKYEESKYYQQSLNATNKSNDISLSVNPKIGYFIINSLAIGISPSLSYLHSKVILINPYSATSLGHSFGAGMNVFIKYYLKNYIFFELESGFSRSKAKNNTSSDESSYNTFSIVPSVGYAIFLSPKVSIEPKINYNFNYISSKSSNVTYIYSINGVSFSAGFTIYL